MSRGLARALGAPLHEGEVLDGCLKCPLHRRVFRLDDGRAARGPATIRQPVWPARVEAGGLQVRVGC